MVRCMKLCLSIPIRNTIPPVVASPFRDSRHLELFTQRRLYARSLRRFEYGAKKIADTNSFC